MTRARTSVALLAVPLLLVGAIVFVAARGEASHGYACGASSSSAGEKSCSLGFRGFPVIVYGDSDASNASIRAWVTVSTTEPAILECTDTGNGFATCDAELGAGEAVDWTANVSALTCHGAGKGAWAYRCTSGCVSPALGIECEILYSPLPEPTI